MTFQRFATWLNTHSLDVLGATSTLLVLAGIIAVLAR